MKYRIVDLFSGCGGFSEGMRQAGHEIVLAVDSWKVALDSHARNHPHSDHWFEDVRNITVLPDCDIIIGSPPCQGLSKVNRARDCDLSLIKEFERIVKINKPKYWVWENVPPVKTFYPQAMTLNSFDFGLSQKRTRCFVSNFTMFRQSTKRGTESPLYNYAGSRTDATSNAAKNHTCHSGTVRTKRIRDMGTGDYLSMDEVKELMGFPLNYRLCGNITAQQKQLGNAVCPPVAKEIGEYLF